MKPSMNQGVLARFSEHRASNKRNAQFDKPMDKLFEPDMKGGPGKPDADKFDKPDLGDPEGMDDSPPMSFDELKMELEKAELTPEEAEELCDMCQEKLSGMKSDDLDTEMDRPEAEMKDHMKKDNPLGGMSNEGAMPPMPPAATPTPKAM
jgi:hypothetical protein